MDLTHLDIDGLLINDIKAFNLVGRKTL